MDWTEVKITVDKDFAKQAESIAHMVVPYGMYIEDYSNLEEEVLEIANIDMIDDDLLKKDRTKVNIHLYLNTGNNPTESVAFLKERYKFERIPFEISETACAVEDWIHNWKKYFKPISVGEKLLIRPIWEENFKNQGRVVVNLEPGLSFGTGMHESTRMCLEMLEKYVFENATVLDIGCGSGILSIASLLLGAKEAVGVDIDELAVKTSKENAQLNFVSDKFESVQGSLTDKVKGKFNVIVANIVADVIIKLLDDIEDYMLDDTIFIMSGIIDLREDDVKKKLENKFEVLERKMENGWVALAAKLR